MSKKTETSLEAQVVQTLVNAATGMESIQQVVTDFLIADALQREGKVYTFKPEVAKSGKVTEGHIIAVHEQLLSMKAANELTPEAYNDAKRNLNNRLRRACDKLEIPRVSLKGSKNKGYALEIKEPAPLPEIEAEIEKLAKRWARLVTEGETAQDTETVLQGMTQLPDMFLAALAELAGQAPASADKQDKKAA